MSRPFDIANPFWVTSDYAEKAIQNGWIGQCLSDSYISQLVRYGTQGVHSHSEMFIKNPDETVDILELREFLGGRRKTLQYHTNHSGRIDVFSPDKDRWPEFNASAAVVAMRRMTDFDYGWMGIIRMVIRRIPFVWRLYPPTTNDKLPQPGDPIRQPFCSHAVSLATHLGGGVDPVPRCPHYMVTPSQLTNSLFYNYEFTIVSKWCIDKYGEQIKEAAEENQKILAGE